MSWSFWVSSVLVGNYASLWASSGAAAGRFWDGKCASGVHVSAPGGKTTNPPRAVVAADAGTPGPHKLVRVRVAPSAPKVTNVAVAVVFLVFLSANPAGVFFSRNVALCAVLPDECGLALLRVVLALQVILVMQLSLQEVLQEVASPLPVLLKPNRAFREVVSPLLVQWETRTS